MKKKWRRTSGACDAAAGLRRVPAASRKLENGRISTGAAHRRAVDKTHGQIHERGGGGPTAEKARLLTTRSSPTLSHTLLVSLMLLSAASTPKLSRGW